MECDNCYNLQEELDSTRSKLYREVDEKDRYRREVQDKEYEISDLERKVSSLECDIRDKEHQIRDLEYRINSLENELHHARNSNRYSDY